MDRGSRWRVSPGLRGTATKGGAWSGEITAEMKLRAADSDQQGPRGRRCCRDEETLEGGDSVAGSKLCVAPSSGLGEERRKERILLQRDHVILAHPVFCRNAYKDTQCDLIMVSRPGRENVRSHITVVSIHLLITNVTSSREFRLSPF